FTAENLNITFELHGERQTWHPGDANPQNLRGTRRTLDQCNGDAGLEEGILSRAGWALFDDSHNVLFNQEAGWVVARPEQELQDWYFFGYGHAYQEALTEYLHFGGQIPLIPRFVLGSWWSRYWAYSDQDLKELVGEFEEHDIPLDVLVIDMDWHTPHSWTGYSWNRELFPDPPAFLDWAHQKGLRTTLNLHPAEGVQSFETIYPEFAEALGQDPATGATIPFRITDKRFVKAYFELLHHPREEEGLDFWWMDWQQGEVSEVKGLDPLLWLNHIHFHDSTRRGERAMLYSRWGGLGNHRYHIGFSGDTYVSWESLQFQPYFTATAANVGYGWWSHDIGGHMGGATEPELYARWVQYGMLSPVLRLHSTKDARCERRPWAYPEEVYQVARDAFQLRYRLIPYIYSLARVAADTGSSLCRPMYYEYPEEKAAYTARHQYFFGNQLLAAPFVHPAPAESGLAEQDVWIPEGDWIDYQTQETFTGPRWVRLVGDLERVPMLMRAGAILPLAPAFEAQPAPRLKSGVTAALSQDKLVVELFPGAENSFRLYEDDGQTEAYRAGEYEWTTIHNRPGAEQWEVEIAPVTGHCPALPAARSYEIRLVGSLRPTRVLLEGRETPAWEYDAETLTTRIPVPPRSKRTGVVITAQAEGALSALGAEQNRRVITADLCRLLGTATPPSLEDVFALPDGPRQATAIALLGGPVAHVLEFTAPEEAVQQLGRVIISAPAAPEESYNLAVAFTLERSGGSQQERVEIKDVQTAQYIDVPFAFSGQVETMHWQAEITLTWRGQSFSLTHQSKPIFPAITEWQAVVYNRAERALPLAEVLSPQTGTLNPALEWESYRQSDEEIHNINEPFAVFLYRKYREELRDEVPLAGYLAATL
ncbi:MAG: glycoside hydrolase family 31 protein, partial [Chloroflexota bacterium]|nr:glycoside hydrolase family 31 protein [Chloroflexota bacterium]